MATPSQQQMLTHRQEDNCIYRTTLGGVSASVSRLDVLAKHLPVISTFPRPRLKLPLPIPVALELSVRATFCPAATTGMWSRLGHSKDPPPAT